MSRIYKKLPKDVRRETELQIEPFWNKYDGLLYYVDTKGFLVPLTQGDGSIYLSDGTLTGNRTLTGAANYLHFNSLSNFTVGTSADINLDPGGEVAVGISKSISYDAPVDINVAIAYARSEPRTNIQFASPGGGTPPSDIKLVAFTDIYFQPLGNTTISKNLAFYAGTGNNIADIDAAAPKVLVTKEWVNTGNGGIYGGSGSLNGAPTVVTQGSDSLTFESAASNGISTVLHGSASIYAAQIEHTELLTTGGKIGLGINLEGGTDANSIGINVINQVVSTDGVTGTGYGATINVDGNNVVNYGLDVNATSASTTNRAGYFNAAGGVNNYALLTDGGTVGFGTLTPTETVQIGELGNVATLKFVDGNQTLNHVLTSDANGVATWSAPTGVAASIYTNSGTVPTTTVATITDTLNFNGGKVGINVAPAGSDDFQVSGGTLLDALNINSAYFFPTAAAPANDGEALTYNAGTGGLEFQSIGGTIDTANTIWVAKDGNDGTGTRGEQDKPFLTIGAALGAAGISVGDTILVRPGIYAESPGTIPAGISLVSQGGYEVTAITGAAVTGNRITLSSGSVINGFNVTIPSDATNAIQYAGAAATVAGCRFIKFTGQAAALGSGLANTGAGKTIAFEIRYGLLDCENILLCSNGILAIQSLHVPGTGTIQRGAKVSGGRLQALDMNIGNANVTYGVEVGAAGIAVLISLNLFNLKNGLLVTGNDAQIDALGGKIQTTAVKAGSYGGGLSSFTGRSLVVDASLSLSAATIRITAQMEPNFVFNNTLSPNAASSDFVVNAMQATTNEREASQRLLGTDSQIGFPEKGSRLMTGEGGPNATFNTVFQIEDDGSAAGVFQADVSAFAASSDPSTPFGFDSGIVTDCIAWCSIRRDGVTALLLKTFGIVMAQRTASTGSGAYVFEIPVGGRTSTLGITTPGTGYTTATDVPTSGGSGEGLTVDITAVAGAITVVAVNQPGFGYVTTDVVTVVQTGGSSGTLNVLTATGISWVEVGVEAISEAEQYRYANDVFLRASSTEQIRLEIAPDTIWAPTTLDPGGLAVKGYWARVRITGLPAAAPDFYQLKTTPSLTMWNEQGQMTAHGLGMWRSELFSVGNVWGEIDGGGTKDSTVTVGSGGVPTEWDQKIKKGLFDGNGDANSFQFQIPTGLCTAYPLYFNLTYSQDVDTTTTGVSIILSALTLAAGGIKIADPLGGIVPVARANSAAEGFTSKAAETKILVGPTADSDDRLLTMKFGPFSISDYYEGDQIIMYLEMDDDGTPNTNVTIWTLGVEGVAFTHGEIL